MKFTNKATVPLFIPGNDTKEKKDASVSLIVSSLELGMSGLIPMAVIWVITTQTRTMIMMPKLDFNYCCSTKVLGTFIHAHQLMLLSSISSSTCLRRKAVCSP